ncbi:MAG TPA: hypothetical protein VEH77_12270 [Roseiarcus sp.]|nr:hypothetical protein [Roseiarcus sp.]
MAAATANAQVTVAYYLANKALLDAAGNISIVDGASHVAAHFDQLNADPAITSIALNGVGGEVLTLTLAQTLKDTHAVGALKKPFSIAATASAASIEALTPDQIGDLGWSGVTQIVATDQDVDLTNDQHGALGGANIAIVEPLSGGGEEVKRYQPLGPMVASIKYRGIVGEAYTSCAVIYGTNGQPASASYSNGMTATWSYGDGYPVASYAGVTGEAYTSYTIRYGTIGKNANVPSSASYSNGMTAVWTYNADGSYSIAYAGVTGEAYTSYTIHYGSDGKATGAAYSNGMTATWSYNADGTHTIAYAGVTGQDYSSYTVNCGANGAPLSAACNSGSSTAGPNLIVNGDFSAGNKGFSTGYTLSTLTPYFTNNVDGIYQVLPIGDVNGEASYGDWRSVTKDPSGGNSDVFAADGATTSNTTVRSETVAVSPNTNYVFSFYAAEISDASHSIYSHTRAVLVPTINGASGSGPTLTGSWTEYSFSWNSGASTSATLSLTDANTSGPYNDFVLDDLSFRSTPETATWSYNSNGGYQIAYTGIVGSAFTGYTLTYGANGRPTTATYNNGMLANWTFNPDGGYAVFYTDVTGQAYVSYTMDYGANGDPKSAAYSNGMTAAWTYNSDGSYDIAYAGVAGETYTSYTVDYGANGKPESAAYSNGMTAAWTYHSDGSYDIAYAGITGAPYGAYTIDFRPNGQPTNAVYDNGMQAAWIYNPDGSHDIAYSGVTGEPYTSYSVDYGANGNPESASYSDGMTATWNYNRIGSHSVAYQDVSGQPYLSFEDAYDNSGVEVARGDDMIDRSGTLVLYADHIGVDSGSNWLNVIPYDGAQATFTRHSNETIVANGRRSELFSLSSGHGDTTITGFEAAGDGSDSLMFDASDFNGLSKNNSAAQNWAVLLSSGAAAQSGADVSITDRAGDVLTLKDVTTNMLSANASKVFSFL